MGAAFEVSLDSPVKEAATVQSPKSASVVALGAALVTVVLGGIVLKGCCWWIPEEGGGGGRGLGETIRGSTTGTIEGGEAGEVDLATGPGEPEDGPAKVGFKGTTGGAGLKGSNSSPRDAGAI